MNIKLIQHTSIGLLAFATRTAYLSYDKGDTIINSDILGESDLKLIRNVVLDKKHESVLEHISYSFVIKDIPRYVLMELTRHRMASYTVQSTRFTLKKTMNNDNVLYNVNDEYLNKISVDYLDKIIKYSQEYNITNDVLKKVIPENLITSLVFTINARSIRNFFKLRLNKNAHKDIRRLANGIYDTIPFTHKFLYEEFYGG